MARKAPRTSLASRGKRSTHPSHASPIPARRTCDCGSGLADTETIPSSGGVLACSRCYNRKHDAYAFTGGVAEHSDDPRDGSGWHYSRNPPQRYTITEGGRRARLAGGNTFPSKGEAQDAAKFLRHTEGGDYKVRALKPGESVGRMAVANGRCSVHNPSLTKAQTDALVAAYAKYKYAGRRVGSADIRTQQRLYDRFTSLLNKALDKIGARTASPELMSELDRRADAYIESAPMRGAGVWW
jgi:hypothetical protein